MAEIEQRSLLAQGQNLAIQPVRFLFSKNARRVSLTTVLFLGLALAAFGLAVTAFGLFYWNYIPRIGFERTVYLQFDNTYHSSDSRFDAAGNPYGSVSLLPDIVSAQRYDVSVELSLPWTPENRDAGNFMLEVTMLAPGSIVDPVKDSLVPGTAKEDNTLAFSRRAAILPYRSRLVESLYRLTELHWYLLGWRKEAESLQIGIFEGIEFAKGWRNVPSTMKLEIQSTNRMQIYSAKAIFRARFRGLRWLMYNHRIISALIFISAFWTTEMIFAGAAWAVVTFYLDRPSLEVKADKIHEVAEGTKQEDAGDEKPVLSDTERTFPSSSQQRRLRYESPQIKQEDEEDAVVLPEASSKATEADDEDEDADVFIDSGIGTSLESSASRQDSMKRRRRRAGSGNGAN